MEIFPKKLKTIDRAVLLLLPVFAVVLSIWIESPYWLSIILFYGLPGFYIAYRYDSSWKVIKGTIFVLIATIPFTLIVDYLGIKGGVWFTPDSIFQSRFLGVIPWEDHFWMIVASWTILIFYEGLLDKGKHELLDKRMEAFVILSFIAVGIFAYTAWNLDLEMILSGSKYLYLWLGSFFFLLPVVVFLYKFPRFARKSLSIVIYFLYLTILFEFTAVYLENWIFTGVYIFPPINFFGFALVPFEELFFVGIVGPLAAITIYEVFDDDLK